MDISRDKTTGIVSVTFDPAITSRQRADSAGRNAFHVPAKFVRQTTSQTPRITQRNPLRFKSTTTVTRLYAVPDWT